MTFLSQRVYDDILLLVQHFMGEVNITVDCTISATRDEFVYDTENTLYKFIEDLQEVGMGGGRLSQEVVGILIDGQPWPIKFKSKTPSHPFSMGTGDDISLSDIGVKNGSTIIICPEIPNCSGLGNMPITFVSGDNIENPSINWTKTLDWYNGVSLDGNFGAQGGLVEGPIWRVLPKTVDYTSVYLKLYGYNAKGEFKTFVSNKTLDEVKHMTAAMFEEREIREPQFSMGWICFLSSKPFEDV